MFETCQQYGERPFSWQQNKESEIGCQDPDVHISTPGRLHARRPPATLDVERVHDETLPGTSGRAHSRIRNSAEAPEMIFRIAAGEAATDVVLILHVDHDRGSLPAVGILAIFLDRLIASLPIEGSDQGDVHDFPPATRHKKHGDTRGVWMPGHRVGVGDLNFAAVRHANLERLKRPLILGFLEFVELHVLPRQPRSAQILTADSVQLQPTETSGGLEINHGIHRNTRKRNQINFPFPCPSVLLTFKIFEAFEDFLTPDGLGSCRVRRKDAPGS